MTFKEIITLLYIKGYYESQNAFLLELLKGSVDEPNIIFLSKSTLKGFFQGNEITELAPLLFHAKFSVDKLSKYIEKLYETKHKDTPTYRERFNGKTYKTALYEKVATKFKEITEDNMSTVLSEKFYEVIEPLENIDNNDNGDIDQTESNVTITTNYSDNVNTFSAIPISKSDKDKFQEIIIGLSVSIDNLLELGDQIGIKEYEYGWNNAKLMFKDLYTQFSNAFEEFSQLNKELNFYYRKYQYELLEYAVKSSQTLSKDSFLSKYGKHFKLYKKPEGQIYVYQKILAKISSVLDESDSK